MASEQQAPGPELEELSQYVQRYAPPELELDVRLRPFLPEFVPSLGAVDDQVKVPRPDGEPDFLGLTVTDEPALRQSDPALLALQLWHKLRSELDGLPGAAQALGWVDPAQEPARVDSWVQAVSELHQGEASAGSVGSELVDLEALVREWPADVAEQICGSALPDPKQAADLCSYARLACNVVDIPAGPSCAEGLHALFASYLAFKCDPQLRRHDAFVLDGGVEEEAAAGGAMGGWAVLGQQ